MTTRDKVLSYCQYCSNRSFDSKKGVYCSLTQRKPDFDKSCPDFEKDIKHVLARGEKITFSNQYTTGSWEKIKDLFHSDFDPEDLEDISIHYSKIKFISLIFLNIIGWIISIYILVSDSLGENTSDAVYIIFATTAMVFILFIQEYKSTFIDTDLIHINSKGLSISGKFYNWSEIVSFIVVEEKNENTGSVYSFLEIEFIGIKEDYRIRIEKLNISKHDLVNLLTNVQMRYIAPAHKST